MEWVVKEEHKDTNRPNNCLIVSQQVILELREMLMESGREVVPSNHP